MAAIVDALCVVGFAAVGRASHDSAVLAGLWGTAWPFLAALAVGWVVTFAWRAPSAPVRTGLLVWVITVMGGMILRGLSGQGTAIAFVIVATVTLGLLLVGWRTLASLISSRR